MRTSAPACHARPAICPPSHTRAHRPLPPPQPNPQEGHCKPGEVLFGTDSHTCNAGAFGQFATGVGNTDAGFILGTGKLLIKVIGGWPLSYGLALWFGFMYTKRSR